MSGTPRAFPLGCNFFAFSNSDPSIKVNMSGTILKPRDSNVQAAECTCIHGSPKILVMWHPEAYSRRKESAMPRSHHQCHNRLLRDMPKAGDAFQMPRQMVKMIPDEQERSFVLEFYKLCVEEIFKY
jgi:hypothetical protein